MNSKLRIPLCWKDEFLRVLGDVVGSASDHIAVVLVPALLCVGVFLTLRLGFVQVRRLGHGIRCTIGTYDNANDTGDVSHFQALSTALSATVGVGNIAGVAMAIHYGGPGALFWMWVTAFLGMAVKYSECTLALNYRKVHEDTSEGAVSGGPMYYIERGLGWKPLAVFFASGLALTSFFTGNAIQANTLANVLEASSGIPAWVTGLVSTVMVGAVILGGIKRIGSIASILAPGMALLYIVGGVLVLAFNYEAIPGAFAQVFAQAFDPVAGFTGVGTGSLMIAIQLGVQRGLFSNEAGQGSSPIAHAAAKTNEPVSEGVVALLEPFIDTIIICTITGIVLVSTGVWDERFPQKIDLSSGKWGTKHVEIADGSLPAGTLTVHDGTVEALFLDAEQTRPFVGVLEMGAGGNMIARLPSGETRDALYGNAVDLGAPLTQRAFDRGLAPIARGMGGWVVTISVVLFALSTAISWSYYGDRCMMYLFGPKAIRPYRYAYCVLHFIGATAAVDAIWGIGDVALGLAALPNIVALFLLSKKVSELTNSYFERQPYLQKRAVEVPENVVGA